MVSSPSAVNDGQWHHAAGVRSSSGYALYLDGQLVATRVEPARDADTSAPLVIGDLLSTGGYGFIGLVDEATIYRRALTSGEIATIYAAGSGGKCGTPRIVHGPTSQVGSWGKTLTLSVVASGAAGLRERQPRRRDDCRRGGLHLRHPGYYRFKHHDQLGGRGERHVERPDAGLV